MATGSYIPENMEEGMQEQFLLKFPAGTPISNIESYIIRNGGDCDYDTTVRLSCRYENDALIYLSHTIPHRLASRRSFLWLVDAESNNGTAINPKVSIRYSVSYN
ncbi:hypothetical protein [Azospirillum brasilense]|uniref:hypothetical protein n=1 Tax=Azospirillum brasilense TaxID=192 RepID=UPI0014785B1A|nr:hypothetical protein [Azospirillum brasilense]